MTGTAVLGSQTPATAAAPPPYAALTTISLAGPAGDGSAIDPASNSLYVSRSGTAEVSVIDLATNTVTGSIPLPNNPGRIAVDSAAGRAYVLQGASNSLAVIDTTDNSVVDEISGLSNPVGVAVDPGTHIVYVTNYDSQTVTVIDTANGNSIANTEIVESRPWAIDVDPSTHKAYATTLFGGAVGVVSGTDIVERIYGYAGPINVEVDPTMQRAYVINNNSDAISVIDTSTDTPLGSFLTGSGPSDIAVDPRTHLAFVTNRNDDTVSVVDQTTNTVIDTVAVGDHPVAVRVDPRTHRVYVTNSDSTVSVLAAPFASQEVTITSAVPAGAAVGGSHMVTATGGLSGNPVTFSTASRACTITPGGEVAFWHVGDCVIAADQAGDADHVDAPTVSQTIPVGKAAQTVTFTSTVPTDPEVGDTYEVTATGGPSGEPVTFTVDPDTTNSGTTDAACSVVGSTGNTVSLDHAGSCVIAADQAGTDDYTAATTATQTLAVGLVPTTTTVTLGKAGVVFGEAATATAAVTGTDDGTVQFTVDGDPVGEPVALASDGTATSPDLVGSGLEVGSHAVGATFTPADGDTYALSDAVPETVTVSRAETAMSLSVEADQLKAVVTPTAPGAGDPTGTVRFYLAGNEIGSAPLTAGGRATLAHTLPTGAAHDVASVYAGDASFTGSSASANRYDPVILAEVTSSSAPRNGWYAGPVTVTFTCKATRAALSEPCPSPVRLTRSAGGQSVTRTIVAVDGGAATAVVSGINIDRVRPTAGLTGVRAGATYLVPGPNAGCRATDALSGVASCAVSRTVRGSRVIYVASVTDQAGNTDSSRVVARTTTVAIVGASSRDGRYTVHRGRTYTVLVAATSRPRYVYAAPSPRRPHGGLVPFERVGKDRWALGVTFKHSMRRHVLWSFGTRVGDRTTVTTVRVVR